MKCLKLIALGLTLCALQGSVVAADMPEKCAKISDPVKRHECNCKELFPKPDDYKKCIDTGNGGGPIFSVPGNDREKASGPATPPPPEAQGQGSL